MHRAEDIREARNEETPGAAAFYIASFADELAQLAKRHGLDTLGYLLDMARLEAEQLSKNAGAPRQCATEVPPRAAN